MLMPHKKQKQVFGRSKSSNTLQKQVFGRSKTTTTPQKDRVGLRFIFAMMELILSIQSI